MSSACSWVVPDIGPLNGCMCVCSLPARNRHDPLYKKFISPIENLHHVFLRSPYPSETNPIPFKTDIPSSHSWIYGEEKRGGNGKAE